MMIRIEIKRPDQEPHKKNADPKHCYVDSKFWMILYRNNINPKSATRLLKVMSNLLQGKIDDTLGQFWLHPLLNVLLVCAVKYL
jgi:hypothetical protein